MFTAKNCKPHVRELLTAVWNLRNKPRHVITMGDEKARRLARQLEDQRLVDVVWAGEKGAPRKPNGMPRLTICSIMLAAEGWATLKEWVKIWRKEERCARTEPASSKKIPGCLPSKRKLLSARSVFSRSSKRELMF